MTTQVAPAISATLSAKLKAIRDAADTSEVTSETDSMSAAEEEKVYQVYLSTMPAHKLIRTDGKILHVLDGRYITDVPADIKFLDGEIDAGFQYLRKGKALTSTDLDPMASLRRAMKEEARAELVAEMEASAKAPSAEDFAHLGPLTSANNTSSTADLAGLASDSNSD